MATAAAAAKCRTMGSKWSVNILFGFYLLLLAARCTISTLQGLKSQRDISSSSGAEFVKRKVN